MGHHPNENYSVLQTWDMHGAGGPGIFGDGGFGIPWALSRLDQAVTALLEDLGQRGLLESTLVVVVGEFGRTPKINTRPGGGGTGVGREHWPACFRPYSPARGSAAAPCTALPITWPLT